MEQPPFEKALIDNREVHEERFPLFACRQQGGTS